MKAQTIIYIYINEYILNLQTATIPTFLASFAEYRAFWHAPPTDRLICAGKTILFVVRNDFSTFKTSKPSI